jgi:hypothetical protein
MVNVPFTLGLGGERKQGGQQGQTIKMLSIRFIKTSLNSKKHSISAALLEIFCSIVEG